MLIVLPFLLLYYGLGKVVHCSTVHENSEDFHSLLDFKNGITNNPNGALSNGPATSTSAGGMVSTAP